jgi:hypothetical protein
MDYRYISENTLEDIYLHDCVIDCASISGNKFLLAFEHIEILPQHPLNFYNSAKNSDKALLIFQDYEVIQSILFDTSDIKKRHIVAEKDANQIHLDIIDLAEGCEVLSVERIEEQNKYFTYKFNGMASSKYRNDFCYFVIKFQKMSVCWNEFLDDSWFA